MDTPIDKGVSTNETDDGTRSLIGHEPGDVNIASSSWNTPVTPAEAARHIEAATDSLTEHLERLYDLMKELKEVPPLRVVTKRPPAWSNVHRDTTANSLTVMIESYHYKNVTNISNYSFRKPWPSL